MGTVSITDDCRGRGYPRPQPSDAHKRFALARMLGEVVAMIEEEAEEMTEIEKA